MNTTRGALRAVRWSIHGLVFAVFFVPGTSHAQEDTPQSTDIEARFAQQQAQMDALRQEMSAEMEELKTELAQAKESLDEVSFAALEEEGSSYGTVFPKLAIFGFFDLTFYKYFFPSNSGLHLWLNDKSTFGVSNANLYVKSQMTDQLSALMELRFSFLPHNLERSYNAELENSDGSFSPVPGQTYQRENTWQRDPFTTETYWRGGVGIERLQLTWTPRNWLQLTLGKFITPYGIWNEEHASTVFVSAHLPYLQLREMIIRTQLGVMIHGRLFPAPRLMFDYAVTVSNGRGGGTETLAVNDYDENKALGLRLRLTYETPKIRVSLGGYGYYGKNTDRKKTVLINQETHAMNVRVTNFDVFNELATAYDVLVELFGLRLQGEAIWRRVDFETAGALPYREQILITGDIVGTSYARASYLGWGWYGLIGYEPPLDRWLGDVRIMPFAMYEDNNYSDTMPFMGQKSLNVGLNIRPSPYVVIKAEYSLIAPRDKRLSDKIHSVATQVAVSF